MSKVHPLPFSPPMARAWYADQKTQTRRICKPAWMGVEWADAVYPALESGWIAWKGIIPPGEYLAAETKRLYREGFPCPYGNVGDRVWVRETLIRGDDGNTYYECDNTPVIFGVDRVPQPWTWKVKKLAPRFCPRWACRSLGEILAVRVERVQDISEEDVKAEGVECENLPRSARRNVFSRLWNEINGPRGYGWDVNPWVWALILKRI